MKVTEYQWYRPDFPEYNVAQTAVIPFCDQDVNLVVCFETAVGKTTVAECCFGYHLARSGKVAYISPYRSLCSEKYEKWKSDFYLSVRGVAIRTGETSSEEAILESAGLTVMTCESFDIRTRKRSKWVDWFSCLKCVVFDEAHMLGNPSRGAAIEASMLRLTDVNPSCRLVLLSATMNNAMDVARWVKTLNGKPTKCCTSDWRPNVVKLVEVPEQDVESVIGRTVELASERCGKTLVFVHSKRVGSEIVRRLRRNGVRALFHNASVNKMKRAKMESAFDDPSSGLDVLVSTSTLGAGVNIGL